MTIIVTIALYNHVNHSVNHYQQYLVGGLEHEFYNFHRLGIIIPTDFHMFQRVCIPPTRYDYGHSSPRRSTLCMTHGGYEVPQLLLSLLPQRKFQRSVDLGCGTGLAGLAIRSRCERLEGAPDGWILWGFLWGFLWDLMGISWNLVEIYRDLMGISKGFYDILLWDVLVISWASPGSAKFIAKKVRKQWSLGICLINYDWWIVLFGHWQDLWWIWDRVSKRHDNNTK